MGLSVSVLSNLSFSNVEGGGYRPPTYTRPLGNIKRKGRASGLDGTGAGRQLGATHIEALVILVIPTYSHAQQVEVSAWGPLYRLGLNYRLLDNNHKKTWEKRGLPGAKPPYVKQK